MTSPSELNRFLFQPFSQTMREFNSTLTSRASAAASGIGVSSGNKALPTTKTGNKITTHTPGGFTIDQVAGANGGQMTITTPQGAVVQVWGDPHVRANGQEQYTFLNDSTFQLSDGTKISMQTVPGPNDQTLLGGTLITNGDSAVMTEGLSSEHPTMSKGGQGRLRDALTDDGMRINVGDDGRLTGDDGATANQSYVDDNDTGSLWGHMDEMTDYASGSNPFEW